MGPANKSRDNGDLVEGCPKADLLIFGNGWLGDLRSLNDLSVNLGNSRFQLR